MEKYPEHLTVIYDPQNLAHGTRDEKLEKITWSYANLDQTVDTDIKQTYWGVITFHTDL